MRNLLIAERPRTVEQAQVYIDNPITIFEKIEFSHISHDAIAEKIAYLENVQVPNRSVLLNLPDEEVVFYWFKNWLHPNLRHFFRKSPADKRGCSKEILERDAKLDMLHFYENGQQNYSYVLEDIKKYIGYKGV